MKTKKSICNDELTIRSISYVANSAQCIPTDEITRNVHRNLDLLVYVVDGYADYTFGGVKHSVRAGDLLYLAYGCNYDRHIKSDFYHFICVEFSFDAPENTLAPKFFSSMQDLDSHFKKLYKTWNSRETSFRSKCMSILYEIYAKLIWNEFSTYIPAQKRDVFKDIIKKISESYADNELSVHDLAQMANMSDVHFRKIFKSIYKVSPQQYIISLRLEHAKELLAFGDASVSSIGEMLGFSDTCYFSRIFKQKIGYTPLEYRKMFNEF